MGSTPRLANASVTVKIIPMEIPVSLGRTYQQSSLVRVYLQCHGVLLILSIGWLDYKKVDLATFSIYIRFKMIVY